jgi:putative Holliday junction resolvase
MRYLGLDLGTRTLGLSLSDKTGMIATSYKILRHNEEYDKLIIMLKEEIENNEVEALVLGFPKNMNNTVGERGEIALKFKEKLESAYNLPVYMQDERLSTVEAEHLLISNDTSRKKRKKVIDGLAATIILQSYLDRKGR